jgi:hypothetical protein
MNELLSARRAGRIAIAALLAAVCAAGPLPAAETAKGSTSPVAADPGWPRVIEREEGKLVYYQPQIDQWKDYQELAFRVAFAVTPKGRDKSVPGIASIHATTVVDKDARTVVLKDMRFEDIRFPSLDEATEKRAGDRIRALFPLKGMTVSLDRLLAALPEARPAAPTATLNTEPPRIFVSEAPAILLFVDGDPILAPIEGTNLKFVVNTNWDLFKNEATSRFYLLDEPTWLTADALDGSWTATKNLPRDMANLPSGQNFDDVKKFVPAPATDAKPRKVFFSSKPAELISFDGKATWVAIAGTPLSYAKNTESDVFLQTDEKQYYFLVSGRWFRAKSFKGPWTYASANLPKDFSQIPRKGPKGDVLASVPGTQEAADAVLLAQVPTTAVVNKEEAEKAVAVKYDGEPKFAQIQQTTMSYATNTQDKVVKIGDLYYLCFQGVWFMSTTASGPWKTCDSVPKEIYTIPPSSPVYNVTYVTVSNPTATTVTTSYTDGYMGMFVVGMTVGACVVYGTGWYYPPYLWYGPYPYPIYRPYPYAYGYGAWYNPATGRYGHAGAVYGPYGMAGGAGWYNPSTGRYGRAATVQTPWGGRTVSGSYNPWTGVATGRTGGWSPYGSWGSSAVQRGNDWAVSNRVSNSQGTVRQTYTSEGGSMTKVRTDQGTVRVGQDANNNMYAGKDGNVYKKDSSGGWSKYENGGWNSVDKPQTQGQPKTSQAQTREAGSASRPTTSQTGSPKAGTSGGSGSSSDVVKNLNRDAGARQAGSQRANNYSNLSRSGGGGRSSSGGRRR